MDDANVGTLQKSADTQASRGEAIAAEGDTAVFWGSYTNVFSTVLKSGGITNNRYGNFHHDDLIGCPFGTKVRGRKGSAWLAMLRASPEMITQSLIHRTQIIYHADISLLLMLLDARPGKVIVEAGTGSGSVSASFARAVRPGGHLHTFEFHEDRQLQAAEDFRRLGLQDVITSRHGDVCQDGLPDELQGKIDGAFFDLPMPWLVVPHLEGRLVGGGRVVMFSPCIEQVERTAAELRRHRYTGIRMFESLAANWAVKAKASSSSESKRRRTNAKTSAAASALAEDAKEEQNASAALGETWVSYQLPMRSHTGYLMVAVRPPDDEFNFGTE